MERLTLEEAINHEKMMAQRKRWNGKFTKVSLGNEEINKRFEADCIKDAEEHEQFTEWLEELKSYKDIGTLKELKELKENGTFTGLELAKLAIMQKELKEYKDLEKQGLLVRLLCKVGDTVWDNDFRYPELYEIKAFSYGYCDSYVEPDIEDQIIVYYENSIGSITGAFPMSEIGKTIFLTREEAVNKLEEMKNEI